MTTTASVTITDSQIVVELPDEVMTEAMRLLSGDNYAKLLQSFSVHHDQIVFRREGSEFGLPSMVIGAGGKR